MLELLPFVESDTVAVPETEMASTRVRTPPELTVIWLVVPETAPRLTTLETPDVFTVNERLPNVIKQQELNEPPLLNCKL